MSNHYALLILSLFLVSISSWPITIPDEPTQTLALGELLNDSPAYATMTSPVPGQVLYPGRAFKVKYTNKDTSATKIQISLFNGTGLFMVQTGLDCRDHKTDTQVVTPSWVADGTYDFIVSENDGQGRTVYNDVVSFTVYVGRRPPTGIKEGASDDRDGGESDDGTGETEDGCRSKRLLRRAPHPSGFLLPQSSQKFTAAMNLTIEYTDGETTADKVKFILRSQSKESKDYPLGDFLFESFKAKATVKLPADLPNGVYKLVAQENSSVRQKTFADASSVDIQIVGNLRRRLDLTECDDEETMMTRDAKDLQRGTQRRTELPSIILPEIAQVLPLGTTFECKIYDQMATTENVQFVLRNPNGREYYLGQVNFSDNVATGQFECPSDIPLDNYSLVAKQNSIARPERFLDVVSTTVIVSSNSGTISLVMADDFNANEMVAYDVGVTDSEQDHIDPVILTAVSLQKPFSHQIIHVGSDFDCEITDKRNREANVQFVIRNFCEDMSQVVGQATLSDTVGYTSCHLPDDMQPGSYDLIVQMQLDGDYKEVGTTSISVANSRDAEDDQKERSRVRLRTREPHLPRLISPLSLQKLDPGMEFDFLYRSGQPPFPTMVEVSLIDSFGHETPLGEAEFTNFKAQDTFTCPEDLLPQTYTLIVRENTQSDPDAFTDVIKIPVNVIDASSKKIKRDTMPERNGATLRIRAPHPPQLITPVTSQNITPGTPFDCHYRDGETTATLLNFLIQGSSGNKTFLGQTSFASYEARAAFQCPYLPPGNYTLVIEENSQINPANFTRAFEIPVNVVDSDMTDSYSSNSTNSTSQPVTATPTTSPIPTTDPIVESNSTTSPTGQQDTPPTTSPIPTTDPIVESKRTTSPTGQQETRPFSSANKPIISWTFITLLPFGLFLW